MHGITVRQGGQAEMAFAGDTPWHGLGNRLARVATIEEWEKAAGMDWRVQRSKVRYATERDGSGSREWTDHNVLFRSDNKEPLGMVSNKFKVVQPRATLEFFRDLVENSGFTLETAGTLFGGRRFWALAHVGQSAKVLSPDDVVGGYLLLCTAVDGTLKTTARFTTVCVVCNNTLGMALSEDSKRSIEVSHRSLFDAEAVKAQLGIARGAFAEFMVNMRALAARKVSVTGADALTLELLRPVRDDRKISDEALQAAATRATRNYASIMELFGGAGRGAGLDGRRGTAWGWVNAVTEHVDFRSKTQTADNRLNSAWFGPGDELKTRAVELALRR